MPMELPRLDELGQRDDRAVTLDLLVSRIEKLWRQANDHGATPAERVAFETKALALMERHRIDAAMLDLERDDPIEETPYGRIDSRYAGVVCDLLNTITVSYGGRMWWIQHPNHRDVTLFGFRRDNERIARLARLLIADAMAQASRLHGSTGGHSFSLRRSFVLGYAEGVAMRIQAAAAVARQQAEAEHGDRAVSAALVVVSRRTQVDDAHRQRWKGQRLRSASIVGARSDRAFRAGRQAGRTADLGGERRVGSGRRAIGR